MLEPFCLPFHVCSQAHPLLILGGCKCCLPEACCVLLLKGRKGLLL
jgi:hypothetical protein